MIAVVATKRMSAALALLFALVAGCAKPTPKESVSAPPTATTIPPAVWSTATAGVDSPALGAVLAAHWDARMRRDPIWATMVGDHRFNDQLPSQSAAALADDEAITREALVKASALDTTSLSKRDLITHRLFVDELRQDLAFRACHMEEWSLSTRDNEFAKWSYFPELHTLQTLTDAKHFAARVAQMPRAIAEGGEALLRGKARGMVASKATMLLTLAMLDTELANGWEKSPHAKAAATIRANADLPANAADRAAWLALAQDLDTKHGPAIWTALTAYRDMIRNELLPVARGEQEGLASLPGGEACYRALIEQNLGLVKTPAELHALGLAEIAKTDATITALGKKLRLGPATPTVASIAAALRKDPDNYFSSAEELVSSGQALLDRATAKTPAFFGRLPKAACTMREVPAAEAPFTTIAYYREPRVDGAKPGEYFINVYQPHTRPKFEFAALTFHESVPGHHLQIAIAQELGDLPAFRKHMGSTAFIEGWGLYAERLAEDMGLYDTDLQRLGAASFESWRAARLVVDTGIHAMGWTRAEAIAFMQAHTLLADNNIENEVDRYISWPAQALAYKVGQLEILALRAYAEAALGDKFSLPAFHDNVLLQGAVTLPVLRAQIERWVASARASQ